MSGGAGSTVSTGTGAGAATGVPHSCSLQSERTVLSSSNASEPSPSPSESPLSKYHSSNQSPALVPQGKSKHSKLLAHSTTDVGKLAPSASKDHLPSTSTTSKVRSLQFSFSCTKKNRSPSDEGEADSEDGCEKSSSTCHSQTTDNKGSSTQKTRVRSNTISRHTKAQCKPSPLNTNTLPNPKKGHHRSTTHPRTSGESASVDRPVRDRDQQLSDFVVSSACSVTAPVTPTSSNRSKHSQNQASSSSSGIDSALSVVAVNYANQSGVLTEYSRFTGHTTPPPEYQEYSPSDEGDLRLRHTYMMPLPRPSPSNANGPGQPVPTAASEYQEPNVDPPPLPPLNVRPDSPECSASSLDDSLGSLKYQPSLLLTDYLDFPTSRSKGHKSKSKSKSASPRTPRTPDSALHHELIPESGAKSGSPSSKSVHDSTAIKANGAALLQYAFEKNTSTGSRKSDGDHRSVSSSASSHDACGLCASLGSPWVDICRAVRASKTK